MINVFIYIQLRSDIDELNELLKQAKRKRAQDLISLEVRKLETELIKIKETIAKSAESTPAPSAAPAQSKRYQIKLNGYGK